MTSQELDAKAVFALRTRIAKVVRSCVRGELAEDVIQELWLWAWSTGKTAEMLTFIELKHRAWDILRCEWKHEHARLEAIAEHVVPTDDARADDARAVDASAVHDVLNEAELSGAEKYILARRYWFEDSLGDIVMKTGLPRDQVVQLEQQALATVGCALNRSMQDDR